MQQLKKIVATVSLLVVVVLVLPNLSKGQGKNGVTSPAVQNSFQAASVFKASIDCITTDGSDNLYIAINARNNSNKHYVAKWNGKNWQELGGTFNSEIACITTDTKGNVYTAGQFTDSSHKLYVAKWNGNNWEELGNFGNSTRYDTLMTLGFNSDDVYLSVTVNEINSLITDDSGNVYATGHFKNGAGEQYVAKWNGSSWGELGGTNSIAFFKAATGSLTIDMSGNIYAARSLMSFSRDTSEQYIIKWNGNKWTPLGGNTSTTFNADIACLSADLSGNVYAGGYFKNNSDKQYVAKWDGNKWNALGDSSNAAFNSRIYHLSTDVSNNVYATGDFTNDSGKHYVAKWNGKSWQELGGINGSIFNECKDGNIYSITTDASGNVYTACEVLINNNSHQYFVAKWNGNIWKTLGESFTLAELRRGN